MSCCRKLISKEPLGAAGAPAATISGSTIVKWTMYRDHQCRRPRHHPEERRGPGAEARPSRN
ncbi:MAG: hypothetical protein MZV49_20445 [Rhodopseudomonas palustris]|nr:hypothetical protein [Rhodopseudomonas palustris]